MHVVASRVASMRPFQSTLALVVNAGPVYQVHAPNPRPPGAEEERRRAPSLSPPAGGEVGVHALRAERDAAVHVEAGARHHAGARGAVEEHGVGDVLGQDQPAERDPVRIHLDAIGLDVGRGSRALRPRVSWH